MKKNSSEEKRSFITEWKLIGRAFGILNKLFPNFWILETLCLLLECSFPYFGLYMSSLIINELAGTCNIE